MAEYFDYDAAKAAGMTPAAIQQFLNDELTAGKAYDLPQSAHAELRAVRQAQGPLSGYTGGTPDNPGDMSPGLLDPTDLPLYLTGGGAGVRGAKAGAAALRGPLAAAGKAAAGSGGALLRGAGGMATEAALEHFLPWYLRVPARGLMSALGRGAPQVAGEGAAAVEKGVAQEAAAQVPKGMHVVTQQVGQFLRKNAKKGKPSGPPRSNLKLVKPKPKGPPGTERVGAAERAASNRQAAKNLRRHPAANEKTGAAVERTVVSPDQVAKSAKIQTWMDQQGLDPAAQAEMWRQILAGGLSP